MSNTTDVAIIGGGVIGCSIAYQLAKRGIGSTLFEKDRFASGASGATAGIVGPLRHIDAWVESTREMGLQSLELFPTLASELFDAGVDPQFRQSGILRVARTTEYAESLRGELIWQQELGLGVGWLNQYEVREREPEIAHDVIGGIFSPKEGYVRGKRYVDSLVHAARELGATCLEGVEVIGLKFDGDKVIGVRTHEGTVYAEHTILATGPWTGLNDRWINGKLPIQPAKGERILLRKTGFIPQCPVNGFEGYIIPQLDGDLLVAATRIENQFDEDVTATGVLKMINMAVSLFPTLAEAIYVCGRAGVRPMTPDGIPLIGPISGKEGLSVATGHDHVGIMLSPATGVMVADYISTGDAAPLNPYSLSRFEESI
ncbi:MAG: glycine oxidase ThiO [SAR202 cluster bacterium]|jgi:glycine oxidase|nr:glycine oxidase ThiO [SAR202 cluster bacterium]